jgi:hypothetical protein
VQEYAWPVQSFCIAHFQTYFFKKKEYMPTNLNALIRYKQIDMCLRNPYTRCTLEKLQEVCSEAMGEHRGIYKTVSKRTIQDDIRVLRSDILGFNAPIVFEDGAYSYADKDYSIFDTPITEKELLHDIFQLLLKEREKLADDIADNLLKRISLILGEKFEETKEQATKEQSAESINQYLDLNLNIINKSTKSPDSISRGINMYLLENLESGLRNFAHKLTSNNKEEGLLNWSEILNSI